jgi:DNA-binding Lrp family transcriptional regulator
MALPIITAIRQRRDLKESLTHTAQELAHLASIYGIIRVSYTELARKCRCSRRTVMRHIQRLEELRILRKTVLWIRGNFCEINTYAFVIAWDTSRPKGGSDKTARHLPPQEREKNLSVQEELANQRKALREGWVTPGSERWEAVNEKIVYLEGLLAFSTSPAAG